MVVVEWCCIHVGAQRDYSVVSQVWSYVRQYVNFAATCNLFFLICGLWFVPIQRTIRIHRCSSRLKVEEAICMYIITHKAHGNFRPCPYIQNMPIIALTRLFNRTGKQRFLGCKTSRSIVRRYSWFFFGLWWLNRAYAFSELSLTKQMGICMQQGN